MNVQFETNLLGKKQPTRGVRKKRSSENMQHIYRRTPLPKRDFSIQLFCSFIGITFRHGCSPVKLQHIFKTPFPNNTSGGLLLLDVFCFLGFCKCSFNHGEIKNFHDCYTCTSKPGRNWFLYLYKVYHSWFLLYI